MSMQPLVSCILPTYNRRAFLAQSIAYFLRQDYPNKELIVVDDGADCVEDLVPAHPSIHYFRLDRRQRVGAKRNLACERASGDLIVHWDDDDWFADWRISYQVAQLLEKNQAVCGLDRLLYYQPDAEKAWEYIYPPGQRAWVAGNTLCYRKAFWRQHPFPDVDVAEDARFVWQAAASDVLRLDNSAFIVGIVHGSNVSPKVTTGGYWNPRPVSVVYDRIAPDASFYRPGAAPRKRALVAASLGIGDILRVTPLIRALHRLGYAVDALIEPDYPEACQLLEGCPEIANLYYRTSARVHPASERLDGLRDQRYEIAAFSAWSAPLESLVNAERKLIFNRNEWLRHGDTHCIRKIAVEAGWTGALPPPFAASSGRVFQLQPGTVAVHPGCKPDWPWKKWHGFDELARLLPNVVLIGTESDLDNSRTYFPRPFAWPPHAQNFIGALSLRDTAALLSQCAALVSNDSGMMHLGVAAGVPTFGVFGITDPARETIDAPNMFPVTKGLACETPCRAKAFGRTGCEHHLECLRTLTAQEVLERLAPVLGKTQPLPQPVPQLQPAKIPRKETTAVHKLGLVYHGHVFDASGYGQAARAYVHALHRAGVELSVADLSGHTRQVRDPLVESLVGNPVEADFHLFHGIPPIWAREAFRLPNAIGMTVWETDKMPTQWRNTLNHVLEVWLPCDFNVGAFQSQLSRPVFKLRHAAMPACETSPLHGDTRLRVNPEDFVFYSIFEWQDRKCPAGQLTAYFSAFPVDGPHVFVLKSNPGARQAAESVLEEARRRTGSTARAEIHCEAWSDVEIEVLQRRGDCYVSLHRGEGWCYPLFEAACRGTPVVATAYSGPLEYLSPEAHQLVPYSLTSVQQPYIYYHPRMRWADPDLEEAARRLRWVYENRETAREKARAAAGPMQERHAVESVGELAKARLLDLLRRSNQPRWQQYKTSVHAAPPVPPHPVSGDWYDAEYFEHGVKSNWEGGYHWAGFQGLFRDTASFLDAAFPGAGSYVDAGCAKGFLVRTLRERGKDAWGFDSSAWALRHAEESAKPFLKTACASAVEWERRFDITLAFDLLSHLTEEQAEAFLRRARDWTATGMLAVITLPDESDPERDIRGNDLSHVTLKSRQWWHDLFVRCGWRKDGLHAILEQTCRRHALPSTMGWQLFLYAPA